MRLAWHVAKHARTHAAVICRGPQTIGIGAGQTSRLDSVRLALVKSQERHPIVTPGLPMVLAADGALSVEHIQEAAEAGITAVIQPGGSSEDKDAVEGCDQRGMAMHLLRPCVLTSTLILRRSDLISVPAGSSLPYSSL